MVSEGAGGYRGNAIVRLVITPQCGLRCIYCHNEGFTRGEARFDRMPPPRLREVLQRLRAAGVASVSLTGGEPTESRRFEEIVTIAAEVVGGPMVHLTTNGVLLAPHLDHLRAAGVQRINVSCGSVDPILYGRITGREVLDQVLRAVDRAVEMGFTVNVNVVALGGLNTSPDHIRSTLDFWSGRGVRLSFLRLAAGRGVDGEYFPLQNLVDLFDAWGLEGELVRHPNRPSTYRYRYGSMDVHVRSFVPDRSTYPCVDCAHRPECSEGLDYPRLGLNGVLRACLLRDDIEIDLLDERTDDAALDRFFAIFEPVVSTYELAR